MEFRRRIDNTKLKLPLDYDDLHTDEYPELKDEEDHAIVLTGYNYGEKQCPYFKYKNCHGKDWGDFGYFRARCDAFGTDFGTKVKYIICKADAEMT